MNTQSISNEYMGSNNSSQRNSMNASEDAVNSSSNQDRNNSDTETPDLQAVLAYLIRSGQVRILPQDDRFDDEEDKEEDSDCEREFAGIPTPKADPNPDTSLLQTNDLKQEVLERSGRSVKRIRTHKPTVVHMLQNREIGMNKLQNFSDGDKRCVNCQFLPNHKTTIASFHHKAFCGTYSKSGQVFLSAFQDQYLRVHDANNQKFRVFKSIHAKDVGWSVLDTAFSPDGNYVIYSSWSDCIHLCNIYGDYDTHYALPLNPGDRSFAIFSLTFSSDNREILGGANDGCLYVYDRECNKRTLRIDAHDDDVNAVAFADDTSHILFSGGDDGLVKVWDRRTLREDEPEPVGTMAGHSDGITFIDSKGDARYMLTNSKDQTMKLWDLRNFSSHDAIEATKRAVSRQRWDYRWQSVPKSVTRRRTVEGDSSIMTYRGHSILHTLIRCHFSPLESTGQRYVYSGCATGALVIYDLLTGKIVSKLSGHKSCTRDVSWHPYKNTIVTTSWDGTLGKWDYECEDKYADEEEVSSSSEDDDDEDYMVARRRSRRVANREQKPMRGLVCGNLHGLFD